MEKIDKEELERVLKQLESQYKVYRAEIRSYNQIAAGSASLLILLLFGELAAAKDNPTMYMLIPLSVISYTAVLSNIAAFGHMAGFYTGLLERKINRLLQIKNLYQYEHDYVGPNSDGSEFFEFQIVFVALPSLMPIALSVYALVQLWCIHKKTAYALSALLIAAFAATLWSMKRVFAKRAKMNDELFHEWENTLQEKKLISE